MANNEWNAVINWASNNLEVGAFVVFNNREVEVVNMCGGQFLCFEDKEVVGLVDTPTQVAYFLNTGKLVRAI